MIQPDQLYRFPAAEMPYLAHLILSPHNNVCHILLHFLRIISTDLLEMSDAVGDEI